jgi:hypothetical protein
MQCDVKRATCDADADQTVPKVTTFTSCYSQQHAHSSMLTAACSRNFTWHTTHTWHTTRTWRWRRAAAQHCCGNAWHRRGTGPSERSAAKSSAELRCAAQCAESQRCCRCRANRPGLRSAAQRSAVHRSAALSSAVQRSAALRSAVQCSAIADEVANDCLHGVGQRVLLREDVRRGERFLEPDGPMTAVRLQRTAERKQPVCGRRAIRLLRITQCMYKRLYAACCMEEVSSLVCLIATGSYAMLCR